MKSIWINLCFFIHHILIVHNRFINYDLSSDDVFLNYGTHKEHNPFSTETAKLKSKLEVLSTVFRDNLIRIKDGNTKVDLIFLIDASSSVGEDNFQSEIKFVKKLLSDFLVSFDTTRIAILTFSSKDSIIVNIDQISNPTVSNDKCFLLNKQLKSLKYNGGSTFTLGAFLVAQDIVKNSRFDSKKVIFLITDGYSNGGNPVPIAQQLRKEGVIIFTIGIRNGNAQELYELSSQPGQYYSFLLDSFHEFESLVRRALHTDQKSGKYEILDNNSFCNELCDDSNACCDQNSFCTCDIRSGQYKCLCDFGYFGSGLDGSCFVCPNGTYGKERNKCETCPDDFHITRNRIALSVDECVCKLGYRPSLEDGKCAAIQCPNLHPPENGYFVKQSDCNNIINNVCKTRCKFGYTLEGPSKRVCQLNGTWSGSQQTCKVKACPVLKAPENGRITCITDENEVIDVSKFNNDTLPIDTLCKIHCDEGYVRIGSRVRNCVPDLTWSGSDFYCKPLKCSRLPKIPFGHYSPSTCPSMKSNYGANCTVTCDPGFKLKGPSFKTCTGKYGLWSTEIPTICKDVTPPSMKCPKDVHGVALLGKNYGHVTWDSEADISDNSDLNIVFWTIPAINDIETFQFNIGQTIVTYVAMDAFRNKATCNFTVEIKDIEVPVIENCVDPVPFLIDNESENIEIPLDEPNIYDNSQEPVTIIKNYTHNYFPIGVTPVKYTATDLANNTNICVLNVTVEKSICEPIRDPIYGKSVCDNVADGMQCIFTCEEGYAFNIIDDTENSNINLNITTDDNTNIILCNNTNPIAYSNIIPECSVTELPNEIVQHGSLNIESNEECKNIGALNKLKNEIQNNVETNLKNICINDIECYTKEFIAECLEYNRKKRDNNSTNVSKNGGKRRSRIQIQFVINGKVVNTSKVKYINVNKFGKIREHLNNVDLFIKRNQTLSNEFFLNQAKYFVDLKLDRIFAVCNNGSVNRRNKCVQCPKGTFHNITRGVCQSCPIGHFNNAFGQSQCEKCPVLTSTRRIRSKSIGDCKAQCPPGTHARKRKIFTEKKIKNPFNTNPISLQPFCNTCKIGFYQSDYGQTKCLQCPSNYTTGGYGSKSINDCFPNITQVCKDPTCNNGTCVLDGSSYTCKCPENFVGSHCEIAFNGCKSNPCLHDGNCVLDVETGNFTCECQNGYLGANCEHVVETCVSCQNGATCMREDGEEFCICDRNHYGKFCEFTENYCTYHFCENMGACVELASDYKCICENGFIGKRCHYVPCDYLPCPKNATCLNVDVGNLTTRDSYRCECPAGFEGNDCSIKINYCAKLPCLNHGVCMNTATDFKCGCIVPYTGKLCEIKLESDFMLTFPQSSISDFVKIPGPLYSLSEISACLWVKTLDTLNYGTMLSYATDEYDNAFTITDYNGIVFYINNDFKVTDIYLNDGRWHFLCVTWSSLRGEYAIYYDGKLRESGLNFGTKQRIKGNGTFVIGQEQDVMGGKFSQAESFIGKITNLDLWYRVLNRNEINRFYHTCNLYYGNLLFWGEFRPYVYGDVQIGDWPFCKKCDPPKSIQNGVITVVDNIATYTCRKGFQLFFRAEHYENISRGCTKTLEWDGGTMEPYCQAVECTYPDRIANGYITGSQYEYGNTITYHCNPGYNLLGHSILECLESGNWSAEIPYCLGPQCPRLEQPGNSLMTVFLKKRSYIVKDTYDVGTQVEFKCLDGTYLEGQHLITCLSNETWSSNVPLCKAVTKSIAEDVDSKTTTTETEHTTLFTTRDEDFSTFITTSISIETPTELSTENTSEIPESTTLVDETVFTYEDYSTLNVDTEMEPVFCESTLLPQNSLHGMYLEENLLSVYEVGMRLYVKCAPGYRFVSVNYTECLPNGLWSELFCKPIACKLPPRPKIMDMKGGKTAYTPGDVVEYTCKEGFKGYGKKSIHCLTTGSWTRIMLRCAKIGCGRPKFPAGTIIIGDSFLYLDVVKIECTGRASKKVFELQCYANGSWMPNVEC